MLPYSASVRIVDTSGRVLYVRRSRTAPTRAGQFEHPAGLIEPGEHPPHAALREVQEETGIVIPLSRLMLLRVEDGPKGRHYVYTARVLRDTPVRLSYEHDAHEWRTEEKATFESGAARRRFLPPPPLPRPSPT
jgi:8-oxo-dGTP pyrophosphatase MutT (NUDIX family)